MINRMASVQCGAFDPLADLMTRETITHDVRLWYLATPFSNYPEGEPSAVLHAARVAAALVARGIPTFCPVAHSQVLYSAGQLPHGDEARLLGPYTHIVDGWQMWMELCLPLMEACGGLIVAQLPGWTVSKGVAVEMDDFRNVGKPIVMLPMEMLRPLINGEAG